MKIGKIIYILVLSSLIFIFNTNTVEAITCANPGKDGVGGTLTGVINTYYPSSVNLSSGSTSVTLGASSGSTTPISPGDLLLIIQMQDASIDSSNTSAYGSGTTTYRGYTSLNNAGLYEYVLATNSVSTAGGTLNFQGSGAGNGLVNSYTRSLYTSTKGQSTFQVIRVPQYSSASLSSGLTALAWNGSVGGILAFDVSGTLNLNAATVNLNGKGFRGGGARQLSGSTTGGLNSDVRNVSTNLFHASKGEGIAGTPRYVYDGLNVIDTGTEGYPNGSFAMGSPGNAGGGGTDGDISQNGDNSGGGGGSNGGSGGRGGNTWSSNLDRGGYGGIALPNGADRIFLGGGGGAGSRNNSSDLQSSGGVGGGIAMIRTVSVSGTGTITANGTTGPDPLNDGGGGGGAGGSILFFSQNGNTSSLTVRANGAKGSDAWLTQAGSSNAHGPGGGGGGGRIISSGPVSGSSTVSGGANGLTTTSNLPYGATSGNSGSSITSLVISSIKGVNTLTSCYPSLTVTKTTSTSNVNNSGLGTTANYTINVSNASDKGQASTVNISDTLPSGFTYASVGSINLSGGATRTTTSNPNLGDSVPNFGIFSLPAGSSVSIPFTVNIASSVGSGIYQNPATASYLDPARTTNSQTTSSSYNSSSSTAEDVTVVTTSVFDFGDAPNSYGTLDASTGAKHSGLNRNLIFLGTNATDTETNGVPNTNADGDDSAGTDDEDSVTTFPTLITTSTTYSISVRVTNNTTSTANLIGWIDFNKNNQFDPTESASTTVNPGTTGGTATLNWSGLSGLVAGQSYLRLRFTTDSLLNTEPTGSKSNGEIEDYPLTIQGFDFGDAPNSYGTLDASTGAKHSGLNRNLIFLGTNATDTETNGVPSINADGDDSAGTDDEDSVTTFPTLITTSTTYSISVRVTNNTTSTANLIGWIDFNGNGLFNSNESASTTVNPGTTGGTSTLNWSGLSGLVAGQSYLRLRFTTDSISNTEPTGSKSNGEVEDYPLTILGLRSISGTVFEDINYGGGSGRNLTASSGVGRPDATVELYSVSGNIATYITSTTTNASGVYTFTNRPPGNYLVRVVNSTVSSSRLGYNTILRGVQTFRTNASTGTPIDVTNYVGGQNPQAVDANVAVSGATLNTITGVFTAGTGLIGNTAQSISNVNLIGTNNITGVDFGFNFDTIVNTNTSGQGSFAQFIDNSNALSNTGLSQVGQTAGQEVSIFMIPNGVANPGQNTTYTNQLSSYGAAQISIPTFTVTASNTSIDGSTQTRNVKASTGQETNSGQIGTGGFVGVSQTRLNKFDNPEIELIGNNVRDAYNSTNTASGFILKNVAIVNQGLLIRGSNSLIQDNVIGMQANGTEINSTFSAWYCLQFGDGTTGMIARHNYVKCNNSAIRRDSTISTSNMLVEYNEVDRPASGHSNTFEAFLIIGAGTNDKARYNLFKNMRGAGSELGYNPASNIVGLEILENTYTDNGKESVGSNGNSAEPLGIIIKTIGTGSLIKIEKNIIANNGATGILVQDTNNVWITKNSIFNNGPGLTQPSNTNAALGIDLGNGVFDPNSMALPNSGTVPPNLDGVSPNDGVLNSSTSNNGTDYPIITSALIKGTTVKVQGYVGSAPNQTTFANAILEFFLADDDGNNRGPVIVGDGKNVAHGEGKVYIDSCNTNSTNGNFNCTFYNVRNVTPGTRLTATATRNPTPTQYETSEFSNLTLVQEEDFLFYPDNAMNALPGDTVSYPHELIASEPGNVQLNAVSNKGWTYTFFRDVNGNSLLDAGDTPYTGGMNPSLGNVYNLNSTHSVKIIAQVFIPSNTPVNTVDSLVITATLTPSTPGNATRTLSVTDLTTVSNQQSGALKLIKAVDKNTAKPNELVTYTINFTNTGNVPLNTIKVEDIVPGNTTFVSAGFGAGTTGTITSPSVGSTGKITWSIGGSLNPGSTGIVTFVVKINP